MQKTIITENVQWGQPIIGNRRGGGKIRETKIVKMTSSHVIMLPTGNV